jgi:hypothetical protein
VNNSVHYTTRISPFELLYRWNPDIRGPLIRDELHEEKVPAAAERARQIYDAYEALITR